MKIRILACLGVVAVLVLVVAGYFFWQIALIGTAYKAKILCSGVFVSDRSPEAIVSEDLVVDDLSALKYINSNIDYEMRSVVASLLGLARRTAIYRPRLGCTLVIDSSGETIQSQYYDGLERSTPVYQKRAWPISDSAQGAGYLTEIDATGLRNAIDEAFSESVPDRLRRTRAVVVVYKGHIIAERYAPGFSHETPLVGWSMTKSVISALVGILIGESKLSLDDSTLVCEWSEAGDRRGQVTLDHLLRMTSGLEFDEDYVNPLEDVTFMLLRTDDAAAFAADKPLKAKPGTKWHYSSGNTNIIARIIRDAVGGTDADYFSFPRRVLFNRIGMHSAVIEPDASGTFVGSSYMYATARDWARFGLLYLQDGMWEGARILPQGWVEYSVTPTQDSFGDYGAHFWLNVPSPYRSDNTEVAALPDDAFHAVGHEGQFVTIIRSRNLIVVRLGLSRKADTWDHESFIASILESLPKRRAM